MLKYNRTVKQVDTKARQKSRNPEFGRFSIPDQITSAPQKAKRANVTTAHEAMKKTEGTDICNPKMDNANARKAAAKRASITSAQGATDKNKGATINDIEQARDRAKRTSKSSDNNQILADNKMKKGIRADTSTGLKKILNCP